MQPVLNQPFTPLQLGAEVLAAAGLLATLLVVLCNYSELPHRIAVHFDIRGRPDGWGPRWMMLVLGGLTIGLYALLTSVAREPHTFNYPVPITPENAARQYHIALWLLTALKVELVWMFALLCWKMVRVATGRQSGLGAGFVATLLVVTIATPALGLLLAFQLD